MVERGASVRAVARAAVIALAATGAVSILGGTAAADTDVHEVTTAQELRAALDSSASCARSVVIEISGVIEIGNSYAQDQLGDYIGHPVVPCMHTMTLQGVTPDAALVSTGTELYGVVRHTHNLGTVEVFDLRIANFENDYRGVIGSAGRVVIARSVFENNTNIYGAGGAVWSSGNVTVNDSAFIDNTTTAGHGAAVYTNGNLELTDVIATGNTAHSNGVFFAAQHAVVTGSDFVDNSAVAGNGGALHAKDVTVIDSTFTGNTAAGGGALWAQGTVEVTESWFQDNEATASHGGAISNTQHTTVTDSGFVDNTANASGGALYSEGSLTVVDSIFDGNTAQHGGALAVAGDAESTTVVRSSFAENVARPDSAGLGGAIRTSAGALTVEQSSFVSNEALNGGAIHAAHGLELRHSTLYANTADALGGAAHVAGGAELSFVTAVANSQSYWGSFHIHQSTMTVEASVIAGSQHTATPVKECHGVNSTITSGGYNVFGTLGCVNTLDSSDQVRAFGEDFGLEEITAGAVGSHLAPVKGGPLHDAIPADHPLCLAHVSDQNGDARPQGQGCDIGAVERFLELPYVATEAPFVDVPLSHPFVDEIAWLATTGVTTGYADNTFRPSGAVSRQAMAAFLMRFAQVDDFEAPATATFADVPTTHDFFAEIEWLASTGITTGYDDGTFRGGGAVSRQAMAAFLMRFAQVDDFEAPAMATFADVPTTHPFFEEIEWLVDAGITTGYDDGTFRGNATVTRQATAAFLYRLYFG